MTDSLSSLPELAEVRELVDAFRVLPRVRHQQERLDRLLTDYARGLSSERRALTVALIGATGAGKSTLLNALAGSRVATEGEMRPTSRSVVVYAPDDAQVQGFQSAGATVERYSVSRSASTWSGQVFLDTPDLNSVEKSHRSLTRAALEQADVAVVVLHRGSVAEATQLDFLAEFARRRRVLFVLNFADELGPTARDELKAQVRRIASEHFGLSAEQAQVFAISALHARRGDGELFEYGKLLEALRALADSAVAERIRASNAVAALREVAKLLLTAGAELDTLRDSASSELGSSLRTARERVLTDFSERLKVAQAHLAQAVRAEAAGRWWGPAALWMRLSALGAGGMGASALVARHSLPAGLAVAATTAVANAVQQKTRAHSAESVVVRGATEEEAALGELARASVTPARQLIVAAGLAPEQLELPTALRLLEAWTGLRASCFAYAQGDAISASVAKWWRWARFILLPLVNLPLIALGGHAAWLVVRGYLEGHYVSADYFINALALAAILSVAGAMLASLSLSGVARSARAAAHARFEAGFDALCASWTDRSRLSLPQLQAAVKRVEDLLRQTS